MGQGKGGKGDGYCHEGGGGSSHSAAPLVRPSAVPCYPRLAPPIAFFSPPPNPRHLPPPPPLHPPTRPAPPRLTRPRPASPRLVPPRRALKRVTGDRPPRAEPSPTAPRPARLVPSSSRRAEHTHPREEASRPLVPPHKSQPARRARALWPRTSRRTSLVPLSFPRSPGSSVTGFEQLVCFVDMKFGKSLVRIDLARVRGGRSDARAQGRGGAGG